MFPQFHCAPTHTRGLNKINWQESETTQAHKTCGLVVMVLGPRHENIIVWITKTLWSLCALFVLQDSILASATAKRATITVTRRSPTAITTTSPATTTGTRGRKWSTSATGSYAGEKGGSAMLRTGSRLMHETCTCAFWSVGVPSSRSIEGGPFCSPNILSSLARTITLTDLPVSLHSCVYVSERLVWSQNRDEVSCDPVANHPANTVHFPLRPSHHTAEPCGGGVGSPNRASKHLFLASSRR